MFQLQLNLRLNSRGMLQDLCSVYDSFSFYSPYKKITSPYITKPVTFVIQEYGERLITLITSCTRICFAYRNILARLFRSNSNSNTLLAYLLILTCYLHECVSS